MLNFIVFFLFSSNHEGIGSTAYKKMVIIEERLNIDIPQLHLRVQEDQISVEHKRKMLISFKKNLYPLLQIFLYPSLGYSELFDLLDMERDPLAMHKFQKLMISILVDRINHGCIESNEELCCYLFSRYNTCSYAPGFVDKLRSWREELTSKYDDRALSDLEQYRAPTEALPHLSKKGRLFLQKKSGAIDRQLSEKELLQEYSKLPDPLKYAVCSMADGGGGRVGFDMCLEQLYGFSLSSTVMQSDHHLSSLAVTDQALQAGGQRETIGSWFGIVPRAVGKWIQRKAVRGDKQALLDKSK